MAFSWQCPFCGKFSTINNGDYSSNKHGLLVKNKYGTKAAVTTFIVCPNPNCKEITLDVGLYDYKYNDVSGQYEINDDGTQQKWSLIPDSKAKVFPDYIPSPIIADYVEACKILNDSPKASATLSRRCLQGMIRDFWSISEKNLFDEIKAIKDRVDPLTWQAIDAVRSIGNIGAHMEKDINLIIDVESGEAELLIGLIETLIKDWYITKHERQQNLEKIIAIQKEKAELKK